MSIPNCRNTRTHKCRMLVFGCLSFVPVVASWHCGGIIISHCQSTTVYRCGGIIIPRCRWTAMYRCSMLRGLSYVVVYWHYDGVTMVFIALICWYLYLASFVVSRHCGCRRFILRKYNENTCILQNNTVQKTWCPHPAMKVSPVSL